MPHLIVEYSKNFEEKCDIIALCRALGEEMGRNPLFPQGGIRVRAFGSDSYYIGDDDPQNAFVALYLRIGAGRSHDDKKQAGNVIFSHAEKLLSDFLKTPYFALSMELQEIDDDFSWKKNTIRQRLARIKS